MELTKRQPLLLIGEMAAPALCVERENLDCQRLYRHHPDFVFHSSEDEREPKEAELCHGITEILFSQAHVAPPSSSWLSYNFLYVMSHIGPDFKSKLLH